jgi:hypothetical protein
VIRFTAGDPHATSTATIKSSQPADGVHALSSYFDELIGVQPATSSIGLRSNETSTEFPNAGQTKFPNGLEIPARVRLFA